MCFTNLVDDFVQVTKPRNEKHVAPPSNWHKTLSKNDYKLNRASEIKSGDVLKR